MAPGDAQHGEKKKSKTTCVSTLSRVIESECPPHRHAHTWSPMEISPQLAAAPSGSNARTYTHEKLMSVPHSIPVARAILTE